MLYGRGAELAEIERLLAAAGSGRSGALVLRGETGIGKSALLAEAERQAGERGFTVLRAAGLEAERDLAFAGLLQLLRPVLDQADRLPRPQAEALDSALGSGHAREQDRFLTGLAVLSLLAEVAEDGPLLCLVDDTQWLDEPTTGALLFAARRLAAEGVAILFGTRTTTTDGAVDGLPRLDLSRLGHQDALLLLAAAEVPAALREEVASESGGNPLALREFGAAGGPRRRHSVPLPAADRVLASFRARVLALPERTRLMLLIAAAEGRGFVSYLFETAAALGVGIDDLAEAEQRDLIEISGDRVVFRHPLIRTAAYTAAPTTRRLAVHQALAAASRDPSCRATHRAAAAMGPDEEVAAALESVADGARARGGPAAAATIYAQAARLSPDAGQRVRRLTTAAWSAQHSGHAAQATQLAEEAYGATDDPARRAELAYIRSFWLFEKDALDEAAELLLRHGPDHPVLGPQMLRTGANYASLIGDPDRLRRAVALLDRHGDGSSADRSVRGLALLAEGDFEAGLPLVAELLHDAEPGTPKRMQAISSASLLPDDEQLPAVEGEIEHSRQHGRIGRLPFLLHVLARQQIYAGRHRDAEATASEAAAIARDTGLATRITRLDNLVARIAAIEGDEDRVRRLVTTKVSAGGGHAVAALSLLDLGLGRYEEVLRRLRDGRGGRARRCNAAYVFAAADEVEAAVRLGEPERAEAPARHFALWAAASGQPWASAVARRNEALLGAGKLPLSPGELYEEALKLHAEGGRPFEQARTELLYGEHLRRERRRAEARDHLRRALTRFERLGAEPWAERTRAELRATGDTLSSTRATAPGLVDRLTPQELQVVRLAAEGTSSREIAARLFLSPRTVEYHLYKAYPKLGVSSRRELTSLELSPAR